MLFEVAGKVRGTKERRSSTTRTFKEPTPSSGARHFGREIWMNDDKHHERPLDRPHPPSGAGWALPARGDTDADPLEGLGEVLSYLGRKDEAERQFALARSLDG